MQDCEHLSMVDHSLSFIYSEGLHFGSHIVKPILDNIVENEVGTNIILQQFFLSGDKD